MAKKRTIEITIAGYTFSLKNLKVHEDMSEETTCFSADLYCNGKKVAHCKNDGRGGETDVYPLSEGLYYGLYVNSREHRIRIRDTEYEKEMDARMMQFGMTESEPWIQYWTDEHLADQLMYKQSVWDDAVKQLKKFAKKYPCANIWFNGRTMAARPISEKEDTKMLKQGYENVTEWVR